MPNASIAFAIALSILGGLIFGYEIIGINSTLLKLFPCILRIDPKHQALWKISSIISSINFGGLIGSALVPYASQKLQPCSMILLGCAFNICIFLGMFSPSFVLHFTSRLLTGVGVGVICTVCPAYVAEVSPPSYRGALSGFFQVSIALGILVASIVSHVVMGKMRDMSADEIYQIVYKSEKNRMIAAKSLQILLTLPLFFAFLLGGAVLWNYGTIKKTTFIFQCDGVIIQQTEKKISNATPSRLISRLRWAHRPLLISIMTAVALQLTGINAVMYYIFRFLDAIGIEKKSLGAIIVMGVNFSATCVALLLADRIGRRPLLIGGLITMSLSMLTIYLLDRILIVNIAFHVLGFVALSTYIYGFGIGPGFHFWVVCNEVLPSAVSQEGFAIANVAQWIFLIGVTYVFPILEHRIGGFVFLLFASVGVITAVFFHFKLPETLRLQKESITALLCKSTQN